MERPALVPFRPSHPPKSGYNGTLGPYPGYVNDPVDPKLSKTSADAKKEREKLGSVPAWRPGGIAKEGPHPSVIMVNMRFKTTAF